MSAAESQVDRIRATVLGALKAWTSETVSTVCARIQTAQLSSDLPVLCLP